MKRIYIKATEHYKDKDVDWIWEIKSSGFHLVKRGTLLVRTPPFVSWESVEEKWANNSIQSAYIWRVLTEEEAFLEMI